MRAVEPAIVALLACGLLPAPHAKGAAANLPVLTQVSQIRKLTPDQVARGYPVHIRAVVTYYSPVGPNFLGRDAYMSAATPDLFIQDSTAGIWVNVPPTAPALSAGQVIDIEGVTEAP